MIRIKQQQQQQHQQQQQQHDEHVSEKPIFGVLALTLARKHVVHQKALNETMRSKLVESFLEFKTIQGKSISFFSGKHIQDFSETYPNGIWIFFMDFKVLSIEKLLGLVKSIV